VNAFTITLPSGFQWTPRVVESIDHEKCVGCGRCFKVCLRQVLQLRGVDEDGELLDVDEDEDDEEYERKVMTVAEPDRCIGCQACAQVCAKKCFTHAPLSVPQVA
jgi:Nif-specific ferredoxin III